MDINIVGQIKVDINYNSVKEALKRGIADWIIRRAITSEVRVELIRRNRSAGSRQIETSILHRTKIGTGRTSIKVGIKVI
jgi:hypothetical protein